MINKKLVGRCGLYCGACVIYRAYRDSERLRQMLAAENSCKSEEIRCEGCQAVLTRKWKADRHWGKNCKIIACLKAKRLSFCYECDVYPECGILHRIADFYWKHGDNLLDNLERIKAGKVVEWLEAEDKKWRCKKCNKPIARDLTECHWCGAKLRKALPGR